MRLKKARQKIENPPAYLGEVAHKSKEVAATHRIDLPAHRVARNSQAANAQENNGGAAAVLQQKMSKSGNKPRRNDCGIARGSQGV